MKGTHSGATQCGEKSLVCIAEGKQHIVQFRRGATHRCALQGSNTLCIAGEQGSFASNRAVEQSDWCALQGSNTECGKVSEWSSTPMCSTSGAKSLVCTGHRPQQPLQGFLFFPFFALGMCKQMNCSMFILGGGFH